MMDCKELQRFLHAYLDSELVEEEAATFRLHLRTCDECDQEVQLAAQLKERLRASAGVVRAPSGLEARIRQALGAKDEGQVDRGSWSHRWVWRLVPAAAIVLLIAGSLVSTRLELSSIAEQTVQWHQTSLPLDVAGPAIEPIKRFFSDKVPFAVRLPRFEDADARLEGARLSSLGGHRAAYLRYRVHGQRVSVFIVDPRVLPSGSTVLPSVPSAHWEGVRGYNVVVYANDGTGYAVTSEMDRSHLVHLISMH